LGTPFFDASASEFLLPGLFLRCADPSERKRKFEQKPAVQACNGSGISKVYQEEQALGGGLGPDWLSSGVTSKNSAAVKPDQAMPLWMEFQCEVCAVRNGTEFDWIPVGGSAHTGVPEIMECDADADWPLLVKLTNGKVYGCDFMISATGVVPCVDFLDDTFERGENGGLVVNENMQTTGSLDIFAAGDCSSITWPESSHWFQMKLWSQARDMGLYTAHCMSGDLDDLRCGFLFEIFTHATSFFGYKVVLLGQYNGQNLDPQVEACVKSIVVTDKEPQSKESKTLSTTNKIAENIQPDEVATNTETNKSQDVSILIRITPDREYIKLVLYKGKIVGALLIGETELEETFENLILDEIDVCQFGIDLLNPDIDIEDYFD